MTSERRNSMLRTALALGAACALTACQSMTAREQGTATGAGIGAIFGAIIGSNSGNAGKGAVIGAVGGAVAGNLWSKHMEEKRQAMEKATEGTGVVVARTDDNQLKVNVPSDFSFDVGRSDVKSNMRPVLDEFAKGLDPNMQVRIVGHTDSTGSDAINNPLSVRRAESVRDYMATKGVTGGRVMTEGQGSRSPVASNETVAGRAQNRRVEIFLREPAKHGGS
ncbi:MAG: putative lipoprotein YiaD [Burkholderiaceae bacterium]|nr:putative lipoprotein YiaD [Burkholderiaceae bacterium]